MNEYNFAVLVGMAFGIVTVSVLFISTIVLTRDWKRSLLGKEDSFALFSFSIIISAFFILLAFLSEGEYWIIPGIVLMYISTFILATEVG